MTTSDRTHAVVVGIERYASVDWGLSGPALDAVRFTRWLVDMGVPSGQIHLLLAPLDENRAQVAEEAFRLGVRAKFRATRDELMGIFIDEIRVANGDFLVVYWGGHGTVHRQQQLLYGSDAAEHKQLCLDFAGLRRYLASTEVRGFVHQTFILDACATFAEYSTQTASPALAEFPSGRPRQVEQFALLAASPGQIAENDSARRTGAMSDVVNAWLEGNATNVSLHQMQDLAVHVKERFKDYRRRGAVLQTPSTLCSSWPGFDEWMDWPEGKRVSSSILALLERQREEGEVFPYAMHEGRLPKLSSLYVRQALEAAPVGGEDEIEQSPGTGSEQAGPEALSPPRSIEEVLREQSRRHLLVVAGPGGGKSTLSARLSAERAQPWLDREGALTAVKSQDPEEAVVPIRVSASDLADSTRSVEDSLLAGTGIAVSADGVRRGLEELLPPGLTWLILIDGLDEVVAAASRRDLVLRLGTFAEQRGQAVRLVVTTRRLPGGEEQSLRKSGFACYELEPFNRPQLKKFAARWFGNDPTDGPSATQYLRQIDLAGLGPLVQVPLLATITAVVYETWPDRPLPSNRYALYEQYRDYLNRAKASQLREHLTRLEAHAEAAPQMRSAVRCLRDQLNELVGYLAVEQITHDVRDLRECALAWLDDQLDSRVRASIPGWGDQVVAVLTSTGLLVRSGHTVRFLHTSFAEHLTAAHYARQLPKVVDARDPAWRTVIEQAGARNMLALDTLVHAANGSLEVARSLLAQLQRGAEPQRRVAAHLLAEGPVIDDVHAEWFIAELAATDPELDLDLWTLAARTSHPHIVDFLTRTAQATGDQRYAAAAALTVHRPNVASLALGAIVEDSDEQWETRCDAVRTLTRLSDPRAQQAAETLRGLILTGHHDRLARKHAVPVLAEFYPIAQLEVFFRSHFDARSPQVQRNALAAFSCLGVDQTDEAVAYVNSVLDRAVTNGTGSAFAIGTLAEISPGLDSGLVIADYILSQDLDWRDRVEIALAGIRAGFPHDFLVRAMLVAAYSVDIGDGPGMQQAIGSPPSAHIWREFSQAATSLHAFLSDPHLAEDNLNQALVWMEMEGEQLGSAHALTLAVCGLGLLYPFPHDDLRGESAVQDRSAWVNAQFLLANLQSVPWGLRDRLIPWPYWVEHPPPTALVRPDEVRLLDALCQFTVMEELPARPRAAVTVALVKFLTALWGVGNIGLVRASLLAIARAHRETRPALSECVNRLAHFVARDWEE
ncbi:caspase family protein [Streptomyces sp. NPDC096193]|uniref:caspase family protein n=1 Tax=Streptomyces sp. NPDC096193 TaxID=3155821 RepID=UPI0033338A60